MNHPQRTLLGGLLLTAASLFTTHAIAQSTGDYRSVGTGNWATTATWERFDGVAFVAAPSAPTSSDGVITIRAGHIVTVNTAITADQVVVEVGATLAATANTFSLSNGTGSDLLVNGTLQLAGATLSGPGNTEVAAGGTFTWTSGSIGSTAVLDLLTGSTSTFNNASLLFMNGTVNNSGTWTMLGGTLFQSGAPAQFNNLPGGVIDLNGWQSTTNSWSANLNNQGTINKNNGTVLFTLTCNTASNSGILQVNSGEFAIGTNTFTNTGSISALPGGTVRYSTGTFNQNIGGAINAPFTQSGGLLVPNTPLTLTSFTLAGGLLTGPQAITIPSGGNFTWTGGTIASTAVLDLQAGSSSTFNGGTSNLILTGTVNNSGAWTMAGGNMIQSGIPSLFNNLPSGTVNLNNWQGPTTAWSVNLNNQGTINKNNGAVQFTIGSTTVTNSGTININSGEFHTSVSTFTSTGAITGAPGTALRSSTTTFTQNSGGSINSLPALFIASGNFSLNAGSSIDPLTQVTIAAGSLTCGIPVSTSSLLISGGVLNGPQAMNVTTGGSFNWTAGFINTSAVLNLATGSTSTFDPGAVSLALGGTINHSGTWTMVNGNLGQSGSPALFNNLPGAVINLNGWVSTTNSWGANLNNQGTITKNNGAVTFGLNGNATNSGTFTINGGEFFANATTFTNTGSITGGVGTTLRTSTTTFNHNSGGAINVPTLTVSGGTCNLNAGSTVNTLSQLNISAGTLNCGVALNTAAFALSGGTLGGPQAVNVSTGGTFSWTGGFINTSAILNLATGTSSTFDPVPVSLTLSGTVNNSGTWTMVNGNLNQSGSPSLFNNLPGSIINLDGWQSTTNSWGANLNNQGTINKNNGAVTFGLNGNATNSGTFTINGGEFFANATTFTNTGSITGGVGTTLRTSTTTFNHNSGGAINVPTLTVSGGTCNLNAGSTVNTLSQLNISAGTLNCGVALNTAAFALSGGTLGGPQAVNVSTGGTFSWTGGFINTSAILNLATGTSSTFDPVPVSLTLSGTVNNSGTWTMVNGNLNQSGSPSLFNNLPGSIINLDGWQSTTNSWGANLNNQGTINKNNGTVTFALGSTTVTNSGTITINSGEFFLNASTVTNTGSISGGTGTTLRSSTTTLNHNSGGAINVPTLAVSGGTSNLNAGSTVNTMTQLNISAGTLNCGTPLNTAAFALSGGILGGPQAVSVSPGGTFVWNGGGFINNSAVLNLATGTTSTFNPTTTLTLAGTVNNSGTWTMLDGNLGASGLPSLFNNLPGGVVDLNGWQSQTNTWSTFVTNQGTFNKNNGAVQFVYGASGFQNQAGGVWNINSGTWFHSGVGTQSGVINIGTGATFASGTALNFGGTAITNNGQITTLSVVFQGSATQQLGGDGSINVLTINNASGVDLTGDQQVNNTLTFTAGRINAPTNALVLGSGATVTGANASRYVNGSVRWTYPTGSNVSRVFPIGDASVFTPVTLEFASIGTGGTLTARSISGDHPQVNSSLINPNLSVDRHWSLSNVGIGFTTANATFTWDAGDVDAGANTAIFAVSKFDSPNWAFTPTASPTATSIQSTGITAFSDFQVGEPCVAPALTATPTDASCFGASDGAVALTVTGGTPVFSFAWSNGASTQNITGVPVGAYSVVVTTDGGCVANADATVNEPPALAATIGLSTPAICTGGSATVNVTGPANGSVVLSIDGGAGPTVDLDAFGNGSVGTGILTATTTFSLVSATSGPCSNAVSGSAVLTVNPLPTVSCGTFPTACDIDPLIPLVGSPPGGTWSGTGVTGDDFDPSVGTQLLSYSFTDGNGCSNTCTVTIAVDPSSTFFADTDGDGAGDPNDTQQACTQPAGFVTNSNDGCPNDPNKTAPGICGCGVPDTDTDNDGIADCLDNCPTVPGQIGSSCDDGDACTVNDVIGSNCQCAGTFADADNDGTCDANDVCPGGPEPGQACDDGNANTINDVVDANCTCAGIPLTVDCEGTPGGTALPGTPCDDNSLCTTGDTFDANCNCVGTPVNPDDNNACTIDTCDPVLGVINTFQDSDGDGTCDANDVCPGGPEPGQACDDGNATTINDVVDASCTCAGIPLTVDCEGTPGGTALPGTPCDDNSLCTTGDTFDANCNCVGTPVNPDDNNACTIDTCDPVLGVINTPIDPDDGDPCTLDTCDPVLGVINTFQDSDGDGTCDANDVCPGGPEPGQSCDDNDPNTIGDTVDANCTCAGTPLAVDCEGTPGGTALPGTPCDDNSLCTTGDTYDANCNCVGTPVDPDDNNACTIDTCDPLLGVINTPIDPDDGDPCTLDTCDPITGVSNVF